MSHIDTAVQLMTLHTSGGARGCKCGAELQVKPGRLFMQDWDRHIAEQLNKAGLLAGARTKKLHDIAGGVLLHDLAPNGAQPDGHWPECYHLHVECLAAKVLELTEAPL